MIIYRVGLSHSQFSPKTLPLIFNLPVKLAAFKSLEGASCLLLRDHNQVLYVCNWVVLYFIILQLDPVVRRGDNFIPGINHAIPRIKFIPGLNCVARSGDKFIRGINRANPGINLTQRFSRVKSLSHCFLVVKTKENADGNGELGWVCTLLCCR